MPPKARILIIDDELPVCRSMASALAGGDYDVDTALSGNEALEKERENRYDVIVSDLMMPGISGIDLLRKIREARPEALVIMVTGYPSIKTAVESIKLGAFDYLPKPFTAQQLRTLVTRALSMKSMSEEESAGTSSIYQGLEIPEGTYAIPGNSWVRRVENGHVRIGAHHALLNTITKVKDIEFPNIGEMRFLGENCLNIIDDRDAIHHLWTPVTGQVIEINAHASEDISILLNDPYGEGWMLLLLPSNFDEDLKHLELLEGAH